MRATADEGAAAAGRGAAVDAGTATAEMAVLMPGVVMILAVVLAVGAAGAAQLRCIDAARTGARLLARHEGGAEVLAAVRAAAPPGASVRLSANGDQVAVVVGMTVQLPLPGHPTVGIRSRASALAEPDGVP